MAMVVLLIWALVLVYSASVGAFHDPPHWVPVANTSHDYGSGAYAGNVLGSSSPRNTRLSIPEFAATFLVLCRNYELFDLLETIQSVQDRFNTKYNYDYVFLNDEPFTQLFMESVTAFVPASRVRFGVVPRDHWSYPDWVDVKKAAAVRQAMEKANIVYGGSESYRHMCRFFSGFFYQHELLQDYDFYWRIEPGIKLLCDVNYDVFRRMYDEQKKFAFTLTMFEYSDTIPTLWDRVKEYSRSRDIQGPLIDLVQNHDQWSSYNLCHFWSNFEIARLDVFRAASYADFFQFLDQAGGFFYERWGDAPVHTMYVSLHLEKSDVLYLDDIGYYHSPYAQCPQDEAIRRSNKCVCDPATDFSYTYQSCTAHFLRVLADL
ncbi:hypothetical protein PSN45_003666 [Yamadazyma tenuis]|uniref:Type II transmembrane protein n=1 Tax=Candida tenuis (strain ATCC 10573 / BCRC 21748 / CBS 615 / JCM 9827 / NBRC 10315 / NRRL Y-1498 / VKM Y-70) TaxID=590646 RepID=G3B3P8_CANTC|nr:type II transmembrane protein [Yamadazyma tenuis ATCC 10573]EGV64204.1 type II transmembrane protein [Yamadazyma tenuis ATCC 10573]WEJ96130.1 hypothetical protein PSN45_003666 [Yamadazyma tenuis]